MRFKAGQKVKILPSAVDNGVSKAAVGKTGKIIDDTSTYFLVKMDKPRDGCTSVDIWAVWPNEITPALVKGQQFLFDFMN